MARPTTRPRIPSMWAPTSSPRSCTGGDSHFSAGLSAPVTISPCCRRRLTSRPSCWGGNVYGVAYQCTVSVSATPTILPTGVITYSLDGAAATRSPWPTAAPPSLSPRCRRQAITPWRSITPRKATTPQAHPSQKLLPRRKARPTAPQRVQLAAGRWIRRYSLRHGDDAGLGCPPGSVTIYDNGAAIGTAAIAANGAFSYKVAMIARGQHSYHASYPGQRITRQLIRRRWL